MGGGKKKSSQTFEKPSTTVTTNHHSLDLALSILLAASVAHVLYLLTTIVPENKTAEWGASSLFLIIFTIAIIRYILGEKSNQKDNELKEDNLVFKTALVIFFTLTAFSISRFFHFMNISGLANTYIGNYLAIIFLLGFCGISFIAQALFKERKNTVFYGYGTVLLLMAFILYVLIDLIGMGGGE